MNIPKPSVGSLHPNMSEQDLLNDLLNQEKLMISNYGSYITETSCPNMRQMLTSNMENVMQDQYQAFDLMRQKGWYPIKDAPDADVQEGKQKAQQLKTQLA